MAGGAGCGEKHPAFQHGAKFKKALTGNVEMLPAILIHNSGKIRSIPHHFDRRLQLITEQMHRPGCVQIAKRIGTFAHHAAGIADMIDRLAQKKVIRITRRRPRRDHLKAFIQQKIRSVEDIQLTILIEILPEVPAHILRNIAFIDQAPAPFVPHPELVPVAAQFVAPIHHYDVFIEQLHTLRMDQQHISPDHSRFAGLVDNPVQKVDMLRQQFFLAALRNNLLTGRAVVAQMPDFVTAQMDIFACFEQIHIFIQQRLQKLQHLRITGTERRPLAS